jgi:hypothetical protein
MGIFWGNSLVQVALLLEAGANKALGDSQGTEPHQLVPPVRRGSHTPRHSARVAALLIGRRYTI